MATVSNQEVPTLCWWRTMMKPSASSGELLMMEVKLGAHALLGVAPGESEHAVVQAV